LNGSLLPGTDILHDIAPVMQMPVEDLFAIAGMPSQLGSERPQPYAATQEIGRLVSLASSMSPEQVQQLIEMARNLKNQNAD
jgi:hypothetical protein